jgi:hypothetical protein
LISTQKYHPSDISIDRIYTVENETINKSTISPVPSDELELPIQPYHASSKIKHEIIHVKNVPLPVEQIVTKTRPSQTETIDLAPLSAKTQQLSGTDMNSIKSSRIVQTE